jgi:peptidoglycan/xylan/chitin deacetylase (PgdA/CDA1 family)
MRVDAVPNAASLGARLFYGGLRACGATALTRRTRDAALILCYHNVVADDAETSGDPELHVPYSRFAQQMRWLAAHYEMVSLRQLTDRMALGRPLTRTAAVTFDDGYAGIFDQALPLLASLNVPATVFVVAGVPGTRRGFWWDHPDVVACLTPERREQWLTQLQGEASAILTDVKARAVDLPAACRPADWATIRAAARRGVEIGAHSTTHRALPALSDAELEHEIAGSREIVFGETGIWPEFFAYPYGRLDSRACAAVRASGYRAGLSLEAGLNDTAFDRSCLRRVNVPAGISQPAFEAWSAGLHVRRSADD